MSAETIVRRPARVACPMVEPGTETVVSLVVNDRTVLAVARRLHDEKCFDGQHCHRRDGHALDSFEDVARKTLGAMTAAYTDRDI